MSDVITSMPELWEELQALREVLSSDELDQRHLFDGWPQSPEAYTQEQWDLLSELYVFKNCYFGGVEQYVRNGKRLFLEMKNPEPEFLSIDIPSNLYEAPSLFERSDELTMLEWEGVRLAQRCVFVLVAGGLGERLGYSGIKLSLPVETATKCCYLEHYLKWINHIAGPNAPVVIMTSGETHDKTQQLLPHVSPGMHNVHLLKQETVFCFSDISAHLALKDGKLLRKPHGHGDVHALLYRATDPLSGKRLVDIWRLQGYSYVVFFQDTNATATLTIPLSLAISARERLSMNFTCIPREPKEAIGLLCDVRMHGTGVAATRVVEYNKLDDLSNLLAKPVEHSCATGKSQNLSFPGSVNTLILHLDDYATVLAKSHGTVPEFINPKFIDDEKTKFKPARIETLMQDVALLFDAEKYKIGGTNFPRLTYQPVKNSLQDGVQKALKEQSPYCATTGERDFYEVMRQRLQAAGLKLPRCLTDNCDVTVGGGIKVKLLPVVVADVVAMGASLEDITRVLFPNPEAVKISERSVLIIQGRVRVESLVLDGALRLVGPMEEHLPPFVVSDLSVNNTGWVVRSVRDDEDVDEIVRMRGFVFEGECTTLHFSKL